MMSSEPALVPELLVADLSASLSFWCDICGFRVLYERHEDGFAKIARGGAHVMLEEESEERWVTASLERPLGRGINFEIEVDDLDPILVALEDADYPLFRPCHEQWYRVGEKESGVRQFLVADPDGYLLRFQAVLGERPTVTLT